MTHPVIKMVGVNAETGLYFPEEKEGYETVAVANEGKEVMRAISMEALVRFLIEVVEIPEARDLMEKHGIEQVRGTE